MIKRICALAMCAVIILCCPFIASADTKTAKKATVTKVTVSPAEVEALKGDKEQFKATVTGTNKPDKSVTWAVEGGSSEKTKIDAKGSLTVGKDETAETLTVTATSVADTTKSGTATVKIVLKKTVKANFDANGDGKVNMDDAQVVFQCIGKKANTNKTTKKCDFNGDGKIDQKDYKLILEYIKSLSKTN